MAALPCAQQNWAQRPGARIAAWRQAVLSVERSALRYRHSGGWIQLGHPDAASTTGSTATFPCSGPPNSAPGAKQSLRRQAWDSEFPDKADLSASVEGLLAPHLTARTKIQGS